MFDLEAFPILVTKLGRLAEDECYGYVPALVQAMGETDSIIAALYWLELEMYNGGFLQFFCNWGYDAYLLALKGLETIHATVTKQLLMQAYNIIQRFENDSQLQSLWDIPQYLTKEENSKLNDIDRGYWEDKENIMRLMLRYSFPNHYQ